MKEGRGLDKGENLWRRLKSKAKKRVSFARKRGILTKAGWAWLREVGINSQIIKASQKASRSS